MQRRMWIAGLFALVACGGSPKPAAPKAPVGDRGVDVANLTAQLPPFLDAVGGGDAARAFSGYVLVAQHDQIIFEHGYGFADATTKRAPTADTSFRIGSVTKQFTAAAILRLEQDGKLAVTDTVAELLPEYPGPGKDVTVHQLLTHTAGIPNYTEDQAYMEMRANKISPVALMQLFWSKPLAFAPGTKHAYSNSGYVILGAIIEKVSGESYADYMAKHIFGPAKLEHTVVGDAVGTADRAEGYSIDKTGRVPAHPIDMSVPFAAGAIRSTARDLMRWHRVLSGDTILSAVEREKLYQPALDGYAYGWLIGEKAGHRTVQHNGGIDGFGTTYWRVPDADLVVVVWTNVEGVNVDPIGVGAIEAALGNKLTPEPKQQPGTADAKTVERLAGTYNLTADGKAMLTKLGAPASVIEAVASIAVSAGPNGILVKPTGQPEVELLPMADGSYFASGPQVRMRFELPASGPAKALQLEQRGLKIDYTR